VRREPSDGRRSVTITFGRNGATLEWSVHDGRDTLGLDCPGRHSHFPPNPWRRVDGRRVYYRFGGIHGGTAWMCIPAWTIGNAEPLEVELWADIRLDSPAYRHTVMNIVATARLVRP
jgi:hypothetical protein